MKLTRACIALLPLFLADTAEAAQCIEQKTNRVRFGEKSRQHYFILAKSGEPCVTAFRRSGGRGDNRAYLYTDLRVLQRAENGVGGVHGPSSFGYQSTPGF